MSRIYDTRQPAEREQGIAAAIDSVGRGDLVVFPTDTLYGLAANAFDRKAVSALLEAKGRGRDMPVPVLVGSWRMLEGLVTSLPATVRELIQAFWPGGLTLVIRHAPSLAWDLGDAFGTVAVRMPLHPVALEVIGATGPLAVSSANVSGHPPAETAADARSQLGGSVEVYLDAGTLGDSVPSTIVDLTGELPRVLRSGAVTTASLREVLPQLITESGEQLLHSHGAGTERVSP
jgi:tRNA threonylcarbamoyl adenosine modification protein (Sua5/YciO/YrdC/YwlC family)